MDEITTSPDYPDTNGDGIPDAFENRLPITEILNGTNDASISGGLSASVVAAIIDIDDPNSRDAAQAEYRRLEKAVHDAVLALEKFKSRLP